MADAMLRHWQMEHHRAKRFQETGEESAGFSRETGSPLDDIPLQDADSNSSQTDPASLESACREGRLIEVRSMATPEWSTPRRLFPGLVAALESGKIEIARFLVSAGAVIGRGVPEHVLTAPQDQQIPLFEFLEEQGWTPNTPGFYGRVLLPQVVAKPALLRWFIDHGADPNLGEQRERRDRMDPSDTDTCYALETAAGQSTLEAVQMLLDTGARVKNGFPLHAAAGACPGKANIYFPPVSPSRDFDMDRIPIMALLVEKGVDVNQKNDSRPIVPQYPILLATMAGAVGRVKWLLKHGANPEAGGKFNSAESYATMFGSPEMKHVIAEGVALRRWVPDSA